MPTKAAQLLDELRVRPDRRTIHWARRGGDDDYGLSSEDMDALGRVQAWQTIFPPVPGGKLTDEQVKEEFGRVVGEKGSSRLSSVAEYAAMKARMSEGEVAKMVGV